MNVDNLLKTTLEKLGSPVCRLKYSGKAERFITYQLVTCREIYFSDDENGAMEFTYRVDIYSICDYIAFMQSVKQAVKQVGFYGITFDPEVFENDTGYYHVPIEMKFMEV